MNLKKIGLILLAALAVTVIIFLIEINFYNEINYTKSEINQIVLLSFIRGLVISLAVNVGNYCYYRSIQKNKS